MSKELTPEEIETVTSENREGRIKIDIRLTSLEK